MINNLHSTMFLLIRRVKSRLKPDGVFTFHNVSINSMIYLYDLS